MSRIGGVALSSFLLVAGTSGALAADEPLSACFDAVGTFITTNDDPKTGKEVGRSLISVTNGGHFFLTDSNEGGGTEFAPFSDGRGSWRCVSDEQERIHIVATVVDFTIKTDAFPDQMLARLDYDAIYDAGADTLNADVHLYFLPFDADPNDKTMLKDSIHNRLLGTRIAVQ